MFRYAPQGFARNGNMHQFLHFWLTECGKTDIILPVCRINTALFLSTAVRGEFFSARRRVSAAPPQGGAASKIFSGGKTKWLLLAPISPRRSSAPRSTDSARECPLPTAARFLPVVVHAAAPVSPTKSGSNLRIVCYR